ncbi:universal stress protein [Streptomyces sp. NPDC089919]|uniref:universal stress protein n=1 Tax=Streptomyces sp. NPDC089919 TaxID=3155188 RepID=UPI003425436A
MSNLITVGLDGSAAGLAAAEWAAGEARLRKGAVELVHAEDWPVDSPLAIPLPEARDKWAAELLDGARDQLVRQDPSLEVRTRRIDGRATAGALASAAADADLLVLGTRSLGAVAGFLVGSVGAATIAATDTPVVLVRPTQGEENPAAPPRDEGPVVLGLDVRGHCDRLLAFACEEADRRGCPLVVVHAWSPPPVFSYAPALDPGVLREISDGLGATLRDALAPWAEKYPALTIDPRIVMGQPAIQILDAAHGARLVVVGRRIRRSAVGARIGPLTHAVMHHCAAPVAVVAHD